MDILTYANWYGLPANDPYHGNYTDVFELFNGANAVPTPANLLTTVSTGFDGKYAFVFLGNNSRVYVAHRLRRFQALAGVAHAQNDVVFATLGEVTRLGVDTIVFPGPFFHRSDNLPNVRTAASIDAVILANPDDPQAAEVDPPDPAGDFAPARSRPAMLIPPHLVGHVLAATQVPGGLSPRGLWTQIARPLLDDLVLGPMCTPFIDWCRVAYSRGIAAANLLAVPVPHSFRLDEEVLETARWEVLNLDLPARAGPPPLGPPQAMANIVAQLGGMRADAAQLAQDAELRAAQQRAAALLPSKRWGASLGRVLALCQVNDENNLPDVWHEMAKTTAKLDVTTIQTFLDHHMPELGASGRSYASATCSSELAKKIGSLNFQSADSNDLEAALSIFSICYPTQASTLEASEAAGHYSQMVQGVAGITLVDTIKLRAAQNFLLPVNLMQVKRVSWAFHRLLAVLFGMNHGVTAAFGLFVESLDARESHLSDDFSNVYICASLLRFVQLRMFKWARNQMDNPEIPLAAPDFAIVFDEIDELRWKPPPLPPKYLQPYTPSYQESAPATPHAANPAAAPLAGKFNVKPEFLDKERVPIQRHFATKRHRDAHGDPPLNDKGKAMCLLFHVRASCSHDCPRANDHYLHSPAESLRLAEYLALGKPTPTPPAN